MSGTYRDEREAIAHENETLRRENAALKAALSGLPQPAKLQSKVPLIALLAGLITAVTVAGAVAFLTGRSAAPVEVSAVATHALPAHPVRVSPVLVTIARDGALQFDGAQVSLPELQARAAMIGQTTPDTHVRIAADSAVPHARVVEVMDALRTAGLSRIAILVAQQ
ncbi:MAG: biopolymer transporter ExbD [Deltaproteobacteria bacterium]|nr:biopolymer transporter ExbD [Deltaproteobacteria bacterium]